MNDLLLKGWMKFKSAAARFERDEQGASDMVAVVVLIVIVVAVAVIFRTGIKNAATSAISKLTSFVK